MSHKEHVRAKNMPQGEHTRELHQITNAHADGSKVIDAAAARAIKQFLARELKRRMYIRNVFRRARRSTTDILKYLELETPKQIATDQVKAEAMRLSHLLAFHHHFYEAEEKQCPDCGDLELAKAATQ